MVDSLYSFGVAHPGAITLHNYPRFLQQFHAADGTIVDLAATDVLRDRERGVPRYNEFRRLLPPEAGGAFEELTGGTRSGPRELAEVYGDVERVDLMVGLYAEPLPPGFGFSDTAFRVFILMASRRLKSDRFFTRRLHAEVYTQAGIDWIDDNTMVDVLMRHYPELEPALRGVENAFAALAPRGVSGPDPGPGFGIPPPTRATSCWTRSRASRSSPSSWSGESIRSSGRCSTALLRDRLTAATTGLINRKRKDEGFALAEERPIDDEEEYLQDIIDTFTAQIRGALEPGPRASAAATRRRTGVVRGEFTVLRDLPENLRARASSRSRGPTARGCASPARARSRRPTSRTSASCASAIKLHGRPGPEADGRRAAHPGPVRRRRRPTFVTPNIARRTRNCSTGACANAPIVLLRPLPPDRTCSTRSCSSSGRTTQTQPARGASTSAASRTCSARARRCSTRSSRAEPRTRVPRLPRGRRTNYLRDAMVETLAEQDVEFDFLVQVQTDPFRMPIENAGVIWPSACRRASRSRGCASRGRRSTRPSSSRSRAC